MGQRCQPVYGRHVVRFSIAGQYLFSFAINGIIPSHMPAAYDTYDYPAYWDNRDYEHASEFLAIKKMLLKIPKVDRSIEVGFGRLLPSYMFRVKKIVLSDPSARLISKARAKYKESLLLRGKEIEFIQSTLGNLKNSKKAKSFDLCIMVRVLHHIENIDKAFLDISRLLKDKGYFILEFPNKSHLKASIKKIWAGDLTYPLNIFPVDIRHKKNIKKRTLPFINYHPDQVIEKIEEAGFEIIETRSVSNIRSTFMKRLFPLSFLLDLENLLQIPLSKVNFGPSFFVLARKSNT
jgi:ubiquinone/menaquinone biosynthesis C-methylase UbiE